MAERGNILRDTSVGDGIIFINGVQKNFSLERNWRSAVPPKSGMKVDVTFDANGDIDTVTIVDESQLAKEQALKAIDVLSNHGREGANALISRVGHTTLVALALLAIAWFFLNTISIRISVSQSAGITFYELLKIINNSVSIRSIGGLGGYGAGLYGLLAWVALLAPLTPHFLTNRSAPLGYLAPLAYMLSLVAYAYVKFKNEITKSAEISTNFGNLFGQQASEMAQDMLNEMVTQALNAISLGAGFYVALAVSVYLAFIGIKKYLAAKAVA